MTYVSPEQIMTDRANYARAGVSKGKTVVVAQCEDGILFVAENPSASLYKISEIYDRIAFAAVGRYNEFENLRLAGISYADIRGYSYSRQDVTATSVAKFYSQQLGAVFSSFNDKPFEVQLLVAEVGTTCDSDVIYRINYDGTIKQVRGISAIGANAEPAIEACQSTLTAEAPLQEALATIVNHLAISDATVCEAALLERSTPQRRHFRRLSRGDIEAVR